MIEGAPTMKTVILSAMLAIVVATTGAVSASAHTLPGQPGWAQKVFAPKN
jgi:threonine synthase